VARGLLFAGGAGERPEFQQRAGCVVRPVLPLREHAQPPLLVFWQAGQRLVHPGEVGWPVVGKEF